MPQNGEGWRTTRGHLVFLSFQAVLDMWWGSPNPGEHALRLYACGGTLEVIAPKALSSSSHWEMCFDCSVGAERITAPGKARGCLL